MITGKKYSYMGNPIYTHLKKHYCPNCGEKLEIGSIKTIVNSRSPEARNYDLSCGDSTLIGNIEFYTAAFHCPQCLRDIPFKEMRRLEGYTNEGQKKSFKKRILILSVISVFLVIAGFYEYPYHFVGDVGPNIKRQDMAFPDRFYGIDSDANGRVYVGFSQGIFVFSSEGEFLYRYQTRLNGKYRFRVYTDQLTVYYYADNRSGQNEQISYSLNGDERSTTYTKPSVDPEQDVAPVAITCGEDGFPTYSFRNNLGIWQVLNAEGKPVKTIPPIVFLTKGAVLFLFVLVTCAILSLIDKWRSRKQ